MIFLCTTYDRTSTVLVCTCTCSLFLPVSNLNENSITLQRTIQIHVANGIRTIGNPHVELAEPVLQRVHRHDDQHALAARVTQEAVDERDHLQRLAQAHAVRQNAAEAVARLVLLQRLNEIVVQEAHAADLMIDALNNHMENFAT